MNGLLERLQEGYSLPSLSPVAMKIVEMASDELCSAQSMARLIDTDPSLAVRLLRLANSAFFAGPCPVNTLGEAIFRVGTERLRIMALSLSLRDTFPMGKVGAMDYGAFWRASLYRAMLSKSLAQELGNCNPEEAFVAGLTLEVGLLIFVDLFIRGRKEEARLEQNTSASLLSWERERYGTDHRAVGEAALRHWRFPESIVACQSFSEHGQENGSNGALPQLCEAARRLSLLICDESAELDPVFAALESRFAVSHETVHELLAATFDKVQEIAETLEVEVSKERDVAELLEKANRSLTKIFDRMAPPAQKASGSALASFDVLRESRLDPTAVLQTLEAVSHEIRNPLMVVGGLARRLSRTMDPSSTGGKYARSILDEVDRLELAMIRMTQVTTPE